MADQTVKVTNDAGSKERVAYDLMEKIMFKDTQSQYSTKQEIIDLYVDCLWAAHQNRTGGR